MATTAKRSPPFRAEQLGSLLRPDDLIQKRYAVAKGEADASELAPLEDSSVEDIVKLQQECGIHSFSDGQSFLLFEPGNRMKTPEQTVFVRERDCYLEGKHRYSRMNR